MIILGENRREAINRVQERLGSVTPRTVAEQTFRTLVKKGIITETANGFMISEDVTDQNMRDQATADIHTAADKRAQSTSNLRHFAVSQHNFKRARIANSWSQQMADVFAPTLMAAMNKKTTKPVDDEE